MLSVFHQLQFVKSIDILEKTFHCKKDHNYGNFRGNTQCSTIKTMSLKPLASLLNCSGMIVSLSDQFWIKWLTANAHLGISIWHNHSYRYPTFSTNNIHFVLNWGELLLKIRNTPNSMLQYTVSHVLKPVYTPQALNTGTYTNVLTSRMANFIPPKHSTQKPTSIKCDDKQDGLFYSVG